ncbi:MAG: chalcone isomerase family protein [Hahellaceae bacterium]|nr:chalcone isomerase family protein [Hahellaceae bacterium]MCP5210274.1 chalcone isomerase family protein [Hahellaceae bacterium]
MKHIISALVLTLGMSSLASAKEVAGVQIPDSFKVDNAELALNGAGIRTKLFMDIYVGGLYLSKASNNANEIIAADSPMAIKLHIVSGLLTSEKMKEATMEGFENATGGKIADIKPEIDQFIAVFDKPIVENDVFDLVYVPGKGVQVYTNSALVATIQGGMEFKKALFGIWLSDKPAHDGLKSEMLGG